MDEEKAGKKTNSSKILIIIFVIFVIIAILAVVFRKEILKLVGHEDRSSVAELQSNEAEDGNVLSEVADTSLPKDFPEDFPIYENATIISSWSETGNDSKGLSVVWQSNDSIKSIINFYKTELDELGWETDSVFEDDSSLTLAFRKAEKEGFLGITKGEENDVIISVAIGVK
jgi:hypothetical protein